MRNTLMMLLAVLALVVPAAVSAQDWRADASSATDFWRTLGDPTLERLITQAVEANKDLRAAQARTHAARATRAGAALDLAPTVTAQTGYNRQRLSSATVPGIGGRLPDQDVWDAGLQLSWEVDVFGRARRSLQGQNALLASAEEGTRDVQVLVVSEVARAYFELRGAQDRLAVARRNADNQRRTHELTLHRLEAGRGNALDSERAQAQLSSTLAEIPTLESAIATSQHRIAVLLGRDPASLAQELDGAGAIANLPVEIAAADRQNIVQRRPDVLSAENRVAARRAFVGSAKAAYLPRVSISGVAGYTANTFDALGNTGTPRYAIGPVLSWPFLDLGHVKTGVDEARAHEREAAAQYEQTILRAREEVETSLTGYSKARERLQHLEDAAAASERATELARLRFEEGGDDFLQVLDAERRQLETQDRLAAGRSNATTWLVAVYRAVGGRIPAPQ